MSTNVVFGVVGGLVGGYAVARAYDYYVEHEEDDEDAVFEEIYLEKGPAGLKRYFKREGYAEDSEEADDLVLEFEEENDSIVRKYEKRKERKAAAEARAEERRKAAEARRKTSRTRATATA